jgi:hypothetical protein
MALITVANIKKLRSRVVREKLKKSEPGNGSPPFIPKWLQDLGGSVLGSLGGGLKRFAGWAFGGLIKLGVLSFDGIWSSVIQGTQSIINFDWNQADKAIEAQITQNNKSIVTALAGSLGELVGLGIVGLATISVGGLIGGVAKGTKLAIAAMKVPVIQSGIGADLLDEANQELISGLRNFLSTSATAVASNLFLISVLSVRRNQWFGQKRVNTAKPNGSIATKIDTKIEKIPEFWREPFQAFLSGLGSGIERGGYVVARSFDAAVAEAAYANRRQGEEYTIEIVPNANSVDPVKKAVGETIGPIKLSGTQDEILEAIPEVMGLAPLLTRDNAPAPPQTWAVKPGADRPQLAMVYSTANGQQRTLHIPHYRGPNPPPLPAFSAGPWLGFWVLNDGSKLQIYAASRQEALRTLGRFGQHVDPLKKRGTRPIARESGQSIRVQKLTPLRATYYHRGAGEKPLWSAFL